MVSGRTLLGLCLLTAGACSDKQGNAAFTSADRLALEALVKQREAAMLSRDIEAIARQFDPNATFINGGGYYYQGLESVKAFHKAMFTNDSLTYTYKTGKVKVSPVHPSVALVYYSWQQQWMLKNAPSDTLNEVGLMTITAVKTQGQWKWRAITNQRTREYFEDIAAHQAPAIQ